MVRKIRTNFAFHKNETQQYVTLKENACLCLSYIIYHFHPCIRVAYVGKYLAPNSDSMNTSDLVLSSFESSQGKNSD